MAAHTRVAIGYNVQVAIDAKNKQIVEQEVTNQVVDMGLLQATAEPAREVDTLDVIADKGGELRPSISRSEFEFLSPFDV